MAMDVIHDPIKAAVRAAMDACPTRSVQGVDFPILDDSDCERMLRVAMRAYFQCLLDET